MNYAKKTAQYVLICIFAFLSALNYTIFVFPNSFAPAGIDGICTMIQDITKVSMGYMSLLVNIPLLIASYILLNREFAVKTSVYVLSFSVAAIFLRNSDIAMFAYHTDTGTSVVLAPVAAGTIRGILYALTLKIGATSGGVDIIAALVKRKKPYFNLMNIIFALNMLVASGSYFVYGFKLEPVICSIIYSFITSSMSNNIRTAEKETIKFEIITSDAIELCNEISQQLHCAATIVEARGSFSGENKKMVICVVEKSKVPSFEKLVNTLPDAVMFKSIVNNSLADI